jgi:hypothetical protein
VCEAETGGFVKMLRNRKYSVLVLHGKVLPFNNNSNNNNNMDLLLGMH